MTLTRTARTLAILICCSLLTACLEGPVRQPLHLHLAAGAVVVVWTHGVDPPDRDPG